MNNTIKISKKNVKMIAHRGLSGIECENTNEAFIAAGNRSYYGIETDVHVTKDGKYIIIHDKDTKKETYSLPKKDTKNNKVKHNKKQQQEHVESFESITKNSNKTYYELIENTTKLKAKYLEELKISLLKCISVCGSEFFEQMCVELVCKIYQVSNEQGKVIGGVNDGGIDGIVTIVDAIGFEIENIYLQCKCRQDLKTNSSAKEVREFIGAMMQVFDHRLT